MNPRWLLVAGVVLATIVAVVVVARGDRDGADEVTPVEPVRVASLIGESSEVARRHARSASLRPQFTRSLKEGCAALPPTGHVVAQRPKPGEEVAPDHRVVLQADCGAATEIPACSPDRLRLSARGSADFHAGAVLVNVYVDLIGRSPCRIDSTLRIELEPPEGVPAESISGSPASRSIHSAIGPLNRVYFALGWGNWCGPRERITIRLSLAGAEGTGTAPPAECRSPKRRSVLS